MIANYYVIIITFSSQGVMKILCSVIFCFYGLEKKEVRCWTEYLDFIFFEYFFRSKFYQVVQG